MGKIEDIIDRRRMLARMIGDNLKDCAKVKIPFEPSGFKHIYQSYCVILDEDIDTRRVLNDLNKKGIEAKEGNNAIHCEPYFMKKYNYKEGDLKNSYTAKLHSILIPLHSMMSEEEAKIVSETLKKIL
jgi:dTDP-4-amino-4,6-dideoxygalactose transaminase